MPLTDLPVLGTGFTQTPGPSFTPEDANCYPSGPVPVLKEPTNPYRTILVVKVYCHFFTNKIVLPFYCIYYIFTEFMKQGLRGEDYKVRITRQGLRGDNLFTINS